MSTSLGQQIIYYRKKAGLSRKRLAEIMGVAYDTLRRYENDEREPNISALIALSKSLNVTTDALLGQKPPSDLMAQNSDESTVLRVFRGLSGAWQDRVLELVSWLSDAPGLVGTTRRVGGGVRVRG